MNVRRVALIVLAMLDVSAANGRAIAIIDTCADGGTVSKAPPAYAGYAFDLIKPGQGLATAYRSVVANQPEWIVTLFGPSNDNRVYDAVVNGMQGSVLVFDSCNPHNCDSEYLFGAYDLQTQQLGVLVSRGNTRVPLGQVSPLMKAAIECVSRLDQAQRDRALNSIKSMRRQQ